MPQPILLLIPDLIFSVKIADAAQALGYTTRDVATADALLPAAQTGAAAIVIDMQGRGDWQRAIRALKADPTTAAIPVLTFGAHVDVDASRAAVAAGSDRIVTRGKLVQELPALLQALLTPQNNA